MAARFLLIDGYNLLHAAGMAQSSYAPQELQRCRNQLLKFLREKLSAAEKSRTTIVFDARNPPPDRPAQSVVGGMRVMFANPGGDADVCIQNLIDGHSAPRQITLVSSDHVLQAAARRRQARFVDSDAFFEQLERRRAGSPVADADAKSGPLSQAQAEYWLKIFGDIPETAELAKPSKISGVPIQPLKGGAAKQRRQRP